jgi:hypothetical protein
VPKRDGVCQGEEKVGNGNWEIATSAPGRRSNTHASNTPTIMMPPTASHTVIISTGISTWRLLKYRRKPRKLVRCNKASEDATYNTNMAKAV